MTTTTAANPAASAKPKMPWAEALSEQALAKQQNFFETRVKHPRMDRLLDDLMPLLTPHSESNIIAITGATGVGKTTFARVLLKSLFAEFATACSTDTSVIPFIAVEAYTNGERVHSFKPVYEDMRDQLLEPGANRKCGIKIVDGRMVTASQSKATIASLRKVVESALTHRKTKVCVIDEAYHLLRFGHNSAVMDTLKSLANTTGIKIVLVGSFDLFDLVVDHGQVARRTSVLNLDRYHLEDSDDRRVFQSVVAKLQARWPCAEVPNFEAISDDLLEVSLGCVGLLKSLMLDASAMQLRNNGIWNATFLKKAAKANALRKIIAREIVIGEAKVRDALYGDSLWDEKALAKLAQRMGASSV